MINFFFIENEPGERPVIVIKKGLGIKILLGYDPIYQGLILPSSIRQVLYSYLYERERYEDLHITDIILNYFKELSGSDYPPYDIVKTGDDKYTIELAVAGFKKDELNLEVKDQYLTIRGDSSTRHSNEEYLHKNIARRAFTKRFSLAENVKVDEAKIEDGVLVVTLTHEIPDEQKPKSMTIQ